MSFAGPAMMAIQAAGSIVGGFQQNDALRGQARVLDENARLSEFDGALQATQGLRESRLAMGSDLAGMASGGAAVGGSIPDMIIAQSVEAQMGAMTARYEAAGRARDYRQQAKDARKAGKAALIQGLLGGAASALQGVSQMRADARLGAAGAKARSAAMSAGGNVRATVKGGIPVPASAGLRQGDRPMFVFPDPYNPNPRPLRRMTDPTAAYRFMHGGG